MDPKLKQLFNEITGLIEHVRRETAESHSYIERNDHPNALRNLNECEDEVNRLLSKWRELRQELQKHR